MNPNVKFLVSFINSWYDPPKAKEAAFAMIDRGTPGHHVRGTLRRLRRREGAERQGDRQRDRHLEPVSRYTVLASALWHMEPTVDRAIKAVLEGRFEAADYGQYSYMSYGGASFAMDEKLVPADVAKLVKEKEKEITDGSVPRERDDAEPKSS